VSLSFKVPFGDLKLHYETYKKQIDDATSRVLASGHFILGNELDRFEQDFAKYVGAKHVVGCASGTDAIYLALEACGIGTGDQVIVVAHTAVPTISAISMTGATPVFVDIDPNTYVMDVTCIEAKITPATKAIIPVHLYGQMVDMEAVLALAGKHKLKVIEDVAQATGAVHKGKIAGTLGDFGAFSFYPSKNLGAFGDGGAVSTNSDEARTKLIQLRNYGQSKRYYHDTIGINSRLDEIQAAILSAQLPYLNEWNERRQQIAALYTNGLKDILGTPSPTNKAEHVFHLYVVRIEGNQTRDRLQGYLAEQGVQTLIHYPIPAHLQKAYAYLNYKKGNLPVTESSAESILSLPMFPELTDYQVEFVIQKIRDFYSDNNQLAKPKEEFVPTNVEFNTARFAR
jgi:dTDP-4-amino-4,6-dideoxygalactose transaminase